MPYENTAAAAQEKFKSAKPRQWRSPVSGSWLAWRLVTAVITVWIVASIVFIAMNLSGDPIVLMVDPDTLPEERARLAALLGYDRPWHIQYWTFLTGAFTGNFPLSLRYQDNAFSVVLSRLPYSLILGGVGLACGALLGLLLGGLAVWSKNRLLRKIPMVLTNAIDAVPTFFLGLLLILVFGIIIPVFPISGSSTAWHLLLPATILSITVAAPVARIFRASLLEVKALDHISAARARGLHPALIAYRHETVNALGPVLNLAGVHAGMVFGGAIVVETLFKWPGVGQLAISAVHNRDYPVVTACTLVLATGFALIALIVDTLGAIIDPRVKP